MYAFRDFYQRNKSSFITVLWSLSTVYFFTGTTLRVILVFLVGRNAAHNVIPLLNIQGFDGIYRATLKIAAAIMFAGVVAVFSGKPYYRFYRTIFFVMVFWLLLTCPSSMFYLVEDLEIAGLRAIPGTFFGAAIDWLLMLPAAIIAYYLARYEEPNTAQQDG